MPNRQAGSRVDRWLERPRRGAIPGYAARATGCSRQQGHQRGHCRRRDRSSRRPAAEFVSMRLSCHDEASSLTTTSVRFAYDKSVSPSKKVGGCRGAPTTDLGAATEEIGDVMSQRRLARDALRRPPVPGVDPWHLGVAARSRVEVTPALRQRQLTRSQELAEARHLALQQLMRATVVEAREAGRRRRRCSPKLATPASAHGADKRSKPTPCERARVRERETRRRARLRDRRRELRRERVHLDARLGAGGARLRCAALLPELQAREHGIGALRHQLHLAVHELGPGFLDRPLAFRPQACRAWHRRARAPPRPRPADTAARSPRGRRAPSSSAARGTCTPSVASTRQACSRATHAATLAASTGAAAPTSAQRAAWPSYAEPVRHAQIIGSTTAAPQALAITASSLASSPGSARIALSQPALALAMHLASPFFSWVHANAASRHFCSREKRLLASLAPAFWMAPAHFTRRLAARRVADALGCAVERADRSRDRRGRRDRRRRRRRSCRRSRRSSRASR